MNIILANFIALSIAITQFKITHVSYAQKIVFPAKTVSMQAVQKITYTTLARPQMSFDVPSSHINSSFCNAINYVQKTQGGKKSWWKKIDPYASTIFFGIYAGALMYASSKLSEKNKLQKNLIVPLTFRTIIKNTPEFILMYSINHFLEEGLVPDFEQSLNFALQFEKDDPAFTEFFTSILNRAIKNNYHQNFGWNMGMGHVFFQSLSEKTRTSLALQVLQEAYEEKRLNSIGWDAKEMGITLVALMAESDAKNYTLHFYETALNENRLKNMGKMSSTLFAILSPTNREQIAEHILEKAFQDNIPMNLDWNDNEIGSILLEWIPQETKDRIIPHYLHKSIGFNYFSINYYKMVATMLNHLSTNELREKTIKQYQEEIGINTADRIRKFFGK